MKQYDFNEIQMMQEKALERVRNMQLRARQVVENDSEDLSDGKEKSEKNYITAESLKPYINSNSSADYVRLPVNLPKKEETTVQGNETVNDFDIFSQPDRALLFSLLMLLKSDAASEELMMALLYIML
ncbi:MAG TPA: hypothetical protein DCR23_05555 [Ruminococcaceae bacterium]|nr:hypothetical protein [Oscillospiraceae bacterium]